MKALDDFLDAYEDEHGEISEAEMQAASRRARGRAVVVRTSPAKHGTAPRRGKRGAG